MTNRNFYASLFAIVATLLAASSANAQTRPLVITHVNVLGSNLAVLVLLDANPLTNIKNVGRIRAVILAGRLLERNELDKMLADVKAKARE